jgi:hypothetical protein
MYIIAHWNGHGIRVGCMICGEGFDLGEVAYDAVTEDAPHEMIGAVCDACIVLPEAELRQRLRDAAEALRQEAERLDARAEEPIHVPYPQDIRPTRRPSSACMTRHVWAVPVVSHSPIPCASESLSASVKAINGWRGSTD